MLLESFSLSRFPSRSVQELSRTNPPVPGRLEARKSIDRSAPRSGAAPSAIPQKGGPTDSESRSLAADRQPTLRSGDSITKCCFDMFFLPSCGQLRPTHRTRTNFYHATTRISIPQAHRIPHDGSKPQVWVFIGRQRKLSDDLRKNQREAVTWPPERVTRPEISSSVTAWPIAAMSNPVTSPIWSSVRLSLHASYTL